jgi:hypothetical protein
MRRTCIGYIKLGILEINFKKYINIIIFIGKYKLIHIIKISIGIYSSCFDRNLTAF